MRGQSRKHVRNSQCSVQLQMTSLIPVHVLCVVICGYSQTLVCVQCHGSQHDLWRIRGMTVLILSLSWTFCRFRLCAFIRSQYIQWWTHKTKFNINLRDHTALTQWLERMFSLMSKLCGKKGMLWHLWSCHHLSLMLERFFWWQIVMSHVHVIPSSLYGSMLCRDIIII